MTEFFAWNKNSDCERNGKEAGRHKREESWGRKEKNMKTLSSKPKQTC